ncbi:MAG: AIM24 family protein [Planctomycetales bacterium]|nr:AIM24 family protein [Planctomycetales bacterium]
MSRYSIDEFIRSTAQDASANDYFQLENDRMLEVNLDSMVWMKAGAMVAYVGQIKFTREGLLDQGLGSLLKRSVTGEGAKLTKAEGRGRLYLADSGKTINILELKGDSIVVNGSDLLAFEPTIQWQIKMMKKLAAVVSGGFFNVQLSGSGLIAITTHFEPLTLAVKPGQPVRTDPNATVAWSGNLQPQFKTDVSLKSFFGRGSGESIQMEFDGDGFVVVQPYEEVVHVSAG